MFKNFKMSMKLEKKHFFMLPLFAVMAYMSQELMFFVIELVKQPNTILFFVTH